MAIDRSNWQLLMLGWLFCHNYKFLNNIVSGVLINECFEQSDNGHFGISSVKLRFGLSKHRVKLNFYRKL